MKKLIMAVLLTTAYTLTAYTQTNLHNQVLVYFKTGAQRIAPYNTTVNITSANILNVLANYGIPTSNVVPSFPGFNEADTVNAELGETSRQMNRAKVFTIILTNSATKSSFLAALNGLSEVLYAETNGTVSNNLIPTDGRFGQQWGMRNTFVPGADIHAEPAWDIFTGNPNAIIAIIDNGVDVNHNDLNAKILGGDNNFEILTDDFGRQFSHGSHVAGIAAAVTNNNNNNGVAGVDWQARIHSRNIFDGNGDPDITQSIIDAVNFNNNVWTLNNSWGTRNQDGTPGRYSITVRSAFAQAYRNNRVSCIAMGNHQAVFPNLIAFPAGINSGVISVGATDINDGIAFFSANGAHIDVSAPGVGVWSTNFNNGYIDLPGTSMATPHVAGLASLLKGFNTNLVNDDIEEIIRLSADDVNVNQFPGFDNQMGTGRINAQRALQFLQAPNTVQHLNITGGTIVNTGGNMTRVFLGVPSLPDAVYTVRRSEVRTNITFPAMCNIIGVWGRGVGTTGFREENGRNFGEGICEVVPGTLTNTGATLRTWIYEVWASNGQYIGFFPRTANNVVFQYTILGTTIPDNIMVNGSSEICTNSEVYTITGNTANLPATWSAPGYVQISGSGNSVTLTPNPGSHGYMTLTATVGNPGCQSNPATLTIHVGTPVVGYSIDSYPYVEPNCYEAWGIYSFKNTLISGANNGGWQWGYRIFGVPGEVLGGQNTPYFTLIPPQSGTYEIFVRPENNCGTGTYESMKTITVVEACGPGSMSMITTYPNPIKDEVTVSLTDEKGVRKQGTSNLQMELIDFRTGSKVKRWTLAAGQSSYRLSLLGVSMGTYVLKVTQDGKTSGKILIVEK